MRIHPGETLKEMMEDRGLCYLDIMAGTYLDYDEINHLYNGWENIKEYQAEELGKFFGTGTQFWLNLQKNYDEEGSEGKVQTCETCKQLGGRNAHTGAKKGSCCFLLETYCKKWGRTVRK
jgi:antitoxin HigA-1